jgi:uncharacterized protein YbbC (DUF1343 family)/CubicO group peptidase (beta-lactamase class C family)
MQCINQHTVLPRRVWSAGSRVVTTLAAVAFIAVVTSAAASELPRVSPASVGMSGARLNAIDAVVQQGLERSKMPGCVVTVGRGDGIVFQRAYGLKQIQPTSVDMTADTVFDLASLTKPIATATSVMTLVQQGKIDLNATVSKYLPEFAANGKEKITIRQLLTHQGGLIPDNALADYKDGPDKAFERINALKPSTEPGTKFIYTDVGFIVLAEVVRAVSGKDVHEYSQQAIFQPLNMTETGYLPSADLKVRAATTEQRDGHWMRGEVHDPRAFELGGIAGHAGLFSTADDLAIYATMMLNHGRGNGTEILDRATFDTMTTGIPVSSGLRGLGWDVQTGYSSNRGDLFTSHAFGHGGFTGTAVWIDPELDLYVIFLSNRVHPDGKGSVNPLAGRIGTLAASAILTDTDMAVSEPVLNGIDSLQANGFQQLAGQRVGLITNQTGLSKDGTGTIRLLHDAPNVELVALFSPEHGLEGKLDIPRIGDATESSTGLKVHSLYGESRTPSDDSMQDIDTLVFDIQDIGTRFYTYIATMGNAMKAAAKHDVRFVVLDRVNPIGGTAVAGPVLEKGSESFVGFHTIPVRHGMTVGELAQMFRKELKLDLDLQVIPVANWSRGSLYDETQLTWTNPSPNMRSLAQALLYPGIGLLETTNLSVGRGTDTPFEIVGAPWIDGRQLVAHLDRAQLPGVRFVPVKFTPNASKYKDEECGGINMIVTNRAIFEPVTTGLQIAVSLHELYEDSWDTKSLNRLLANKAVRDAILAGKSVDDITDLWTNDLQQFKTRRQRYLLYE